VRPITRPLLWAAERDGTTSYLFGTLHMGVDAGRQLPPWVFERFEQAPALALEADVTDPVILRSLGRTDGGDLKEELGPDYWRKLQDAVGPQLADGLRRMRPLAVMAPLLATGLPATVVPMDLAFKQRADAAGKPVVYLESARRQLEIIDPYIAARDIRAALDHLDYVRDQAAKMLTAYQAGDGDTLSSMFEDQTLWVAAGRDPAEFADSVDALLGARNRSWIEPIEKLHDDGGGFIAVGAGHLVGPDNVLGLLAARGFAITRVEGP